MKGPTPEEHLKMRISQCTNLYLGNPINLLWEHGDKAHKRIVTNEEGDKVTVYWNIRNRIGVKNDSYHILAGSTCDMIAIYPPTIDEDSNAKKWRVGFFVLRGMADDNLRSTLIVDYDDLDYGDPHSSFMIEDLNTALSKPRAGVVKITCIESQ